MVLIKYIGKHQPNDVRDVSEEVAAKVVDGITYERVKDGKEISVEHKDIRTSENERPLKKKRKQYVQER